MAGFIRRSLQATYNNLFYRMDFIVIWSVTFCTGFSFAELRTVVNAKRKWITYGGLMHCLFVYRASYM